MTRPFHPWFGWEVPFAARQQAWRQDRVFFLDDGSMQSPHTAWADVAEPDVFVTVAAGRSPCRVEDLPLSSGGPAGLRSDEPGSGVGVGEAPAGMPLDAGRPPAQILDQVEMFAQRIDPPTVRDATLPHAAARMLT